MRNTKMIGRRLPTTKPARNPSATTGPQPQPKKLPPSVPIAIYRELSADLQATQASITTLQTENLQLATQNHQLRQELEQLASQTQQVLQRFRATPMGTADEALMLDELGFDADSVQTRSQVLDQLYRALPDYAPTDHDAADDFAPAPWAGMSLPKFTMPQVKHTPQFSGQMQHPHRSTVAASDAELNGWKLTLVMALIVLSAFGAGFLVVRPLLAPNPNR
jgi:regulator of replication initiation timing